jgi:hypothetical protein
MSRSFKEVNAKSYIATNNFNDAFYSYTVTTGPSPQFKKGGRLRLINGLTSEKCPAGRILRENGKKLYPGVHEGVPIFMVGVFDSQTLLSGYINPNGEYFAPFSGEKPLFMPDTKQLDKSSTLGSPVFTQGHVLAANQIVSVGGQVRSDNVSTLHLGSGSLGQPVLLDASTGQTFIYVTRANTFLDVINPEKGATVRFIMNNQDTNGPFTVTFGPDVLKSQGSIVIPISKIVTVTFISDGIFFYETSRTTLDIM